MSIQEIEDFQGGTLRTIWGVGGGGGKGGGGGGCWSKPRPFPGRKPTEKSGPPIRGKYELLRICTLGHEESDGKHPRAQDPYLYEFLDHKHDSKQGRDPEIL